MISPAVNTKNPIPKTKNQQNLENTKVNFERHVDGIAEQGNAQCTDFHLNVIIKPGGGYRDVFS